MDPINKLDISIQQLGGHENLSQRTINLCIDNEIKTLGEILEFKKEYSSFKSLRQCGTKSNNELLQICNKYENYNPLNSVEEYDISDDILMKVKTIINEDIKIQTLSEIEGISCRSLNICLFNGIKSLSSLLKFYFDNKKTGFKSIRNCGNKSNLELINICLKYESYFWNEDSNVINLSPIDEFLSLLKLDIPKDIVRQNTVGFDYVPIFNILNLLIDNDFIFHSKIKTKIFKETLNCYQNQHEYTLDRIGKQFGLTRERIRKIRNYILENLRFKFQTTFSQYHQFFLRYIDSVEQPFIFISDDETQKINNNEGTNFSSTFITYVLSNIFSDYFIRLGDPKNLFSNKTSKESFNIHNLYLINKTITVLFNFEKFIDYLESMVSNNKHKDVHLTYEYLLKEFSTNTMTDYKPVIDTINVIMRNDFNSFFEISQDGFISILHEKPTIKKYIIKILQKSDKPLHYSEIHKQVENLGLIVSKSSLHYVLVSESIFGLKGPGIYDLRSKGGLFGSIGDVTEQILLKEGKGVDYLFLKNLLMKELVVSEDSIETILFSYDLQRRFIKSHGRVYLKKWSRQGQLSLNF